MVKVFHLLCFLSCSMLTVYWWVSRKTCSILSLPQRRPFNDEVPLYNFTWTLITTIACKESHDMGNILAYKSWRRLQPRPTIVYVSACRPYFADDETTTTVTTFDRTMSGIPLFGDMMALSETVKTDFVAWTNADILLCEDVVTAINHLLHKNKQQQQHRQQPKSQEPSLPKLWMAVAARRDLAPTTIQKNGKHLMKEMKQNSLAAFLQREGVLHTQGGGDLFVWNQPKLPIIRSPYPPFFRSACTWDNWWIHEAGLVRGKDSVIDTTATMTLGHVDHAYFLSPPVFSSARSKTKSINSLEQQEQDKEQEVQFLKTPSLSRWSQGVFDDWRIYHNNAVMRADKYARGFYTGLGTVLRLEMFMDPNDMQVKRRETVNEPSAYSLSLKFPIITTFNTVAKGVPSLTTLLRNIPKNEHILLTGVTFGYLDMLMNWICILRQLNMDTNFLVAAFDKEAFEYLYLQGIPVFYSTGNSHKNNSNNPESAFEYGQQSFKDTTKLKITSVKIILDLGYDVLWSDSDIIFFNDFRNMFQTTQHDIIMQSNNPIPKYKGYFNQRINSGFYFIRAKNYTKQLVQEVINHSLLSHKSEQVSFDAIFCADANTEYCTTANNYLVTFFDLQQFPNGGVLKHWDALMINGTRPEGASILHNNWIKGYSAKINRMTKSNFWFWDKKREVCLSNNS